ncbi:GlcG/HbpS family heme-binding protein [Arthrobacter sp. H14]|uniref:GlcG/HbpS family heme-binding protein n=1 Tax=Arthrobacter sp. H14 TaxID=1312959 RepID=UPI0004AE53FF|nr:heme-binding protein [Arthrobacter sp. H14]
MAPLNLPQISFAFASAAVLTVGLAACGSPDGNTPQAASGTGSTDESASGDSGGDAVLNMPRLSVEAATEAAEAALAQCQSDDLPFVSVAVVDRFGQVQAMLRGANAAEHTMESARLKAYTSASFGSNTSELTEAATGDGPTISDLPGTLFLGGGVSIKVDGASIAGIGVGGAPQGSLDEACAQAGLDAIADSLRN